MWKPNKKLKFEPGELYTNSEHYVWYKLVGESKETYNCSRQVMIYEPDGTDGTQTTYTILVVREQKSFLYLEEGKLYSYFNPLLTSDDDVVYVRYPIEGKYCPSVQGQWFLYEDKVCFIESTQDKFVADYHDYTRDKERTQLIWSETDKLIKCK